MYKDILLKKESGVARITINRPESNNSLRLQTIMEMNQAIEEISADSSLGVVVITGAGDKAFCSGGDVNELTQMGETGLPKINKQLLKLAKQLVDLEKPVIAAINGICIGGGNELNLYCDLSIASEQARFGHVEAKIGTVPMWGGVQILPYVVGQKKAREIVLLSKIYTAEEALTLGMINKVVPHEKLLEETGSWCNRLLSFSPRALGLCKIAMNFQIDQQWPLISSGLKMMELGWNSPEMQEGMNSVNAGKKADFTKFRKTLRED